MTQTSDILVVLNTCPDMSSAKDIARSILEDRLAACVNIIPEIISLFYWEQTLQNENECLLIMKTSKLVYPKLEKHLCERHPYEIPEIIALPIDAGITAYLNWVAQSLKS